MDACPRFGTFFYTIWLSVNRCLSSLTVWRSYTVTHSLLLCMMPRALCASRDETRGYFSPQRDRESSYLTRDFDLRSASIAKILNLINRVKVDIFWDQNTKQKTALSSPILLCYWFLGSLYKWKIICHIKCSIFNKNCMTYRIFYLQYLSTK